MIISPWSIRGLRLALANGVLQPTALADQALARSNGNPGCNTYLWQDAAWTRSEASRVEAMPRGKGGSFGDDRSALWGLPISVKDCFDLAGAPTSCGVHFYRDRNGKAAHDSWLVEQLRASGAVITGKTHLHPLAYGITGENPEFGDCLQPGNPDALTGGSSSGAAASVLEGSAVAAVGTDTGGSVRVPAALCGLAGYRATLGRGDWRGGAHLAESFDTMGWLFRELEDAPLLAGPYAPTETTRQSSFTRFAAIADSFLHDCEPEIVANFHATIRELEALGLEVRTIDPNWWTESREICTPATSTTLSQPFANAWNGARASLHLKLPRCASVTPNSARASTSCSLRTNCSCSRALRLRASLPAPITARHAPVCCVTQRLSAWPECQWWLSHAPPAVCNWPPRAVATSPCSNSQPSSEPTEKRQPRHRAHDNFHTKNLYKNSRL
jgi:aspartyl-tRNA(Asn)/glutamyl-tRNA(Gln) amidotransferase subunit A